MWLPEFSDPLQGGLKQYQNSHFVPLNGNISQKLACKCLGAPQGPIDWNGMDTGSTPSQFYFIENRVSFMPEKLNLRPKQVIFKFYIQNS